MIGQDIDIAVDYLVKGEVVGMPTETVYGLAGNAYNGTAIGAIYRIKKRPLGDPLIVHTFAINKLEDIVSDFPLAAKLLADRFWPGPLTLLLPKKRKVPAVVTAGLPTVGVRIPSHPMAQQLLRKVPFPLAAPSANPFGYVSPTTALHVADQLGEAVPYILDGGGCDWGLESTIVGFGTQGVPIVYRLGSITLEAIIETVGGVDYTPKQYTTKKQAEAPGTFKHHYAPRKRLYVGNVDTLLKQHKAEEVGVLVFGECVDAVAPSNQFILSRTRSLREAAQRLFLGLRYLDNCACEVILAPLLPAVGLGKTMNERLLRASLR